MNNIKNFLEFNLNEQLNFKSLEAGFTNATTKFSNINLSGEDKDQIVKTNLKNYIDALFKTIINNSSELKDTNDQFIDDIITELSDFKEKVVKVITDNLNDPNLIEYMNKFIDDIIVFFQNKSNKDIINNGLLNVKEDQKENKFRSTCDFLKEKVFSLIDSYKKLEKVENNFTKEQLTQMVNKGIVYFKLDGYDEQHKDKVGSGIITKYDSEKDIITINDSEGKVIDKKISDILKAEDLNSINDKIKMNLSSMKDDSKKMSLILKFIDFINKEGSVEDSSLGQIKKLLNNAK
jgi:hypothetical protein